MENLYYSTSEMAAMMGVAKSTILERAREGTIPALRFGRLWRFPKQKVEAWLEQQQQRSQPAAIGEAGPPPPSLIERRSFLTLPLEERRRILAEQAAQAAAAYDPSEWEEWQGGDLVEY